MQVLPPTNENIKLAVDILRAGGVVAHATETCYGLACDLTNIEAVQKLFDIKRRPPEMPVSALFEDMRQSMLYLEWNELALQLAQGHLPGPLTIILKQRPDAPHMLHPCPPCPCPNPSPTVGLRISPHPTTQALITAFGSPLSTTSANIHGLPNPYSAADLEAQFSSADLQPDLILDDGHLPVAAASAVIDVSEEVIHVLRKGDIDFS